MFLYSSQKSVNLFFFFVGKTLVTKHCAPCKTCCNVQGWPQKDVGGGRLRNSVRDAVKGYHFRKVWKSISEPLATDCFAFHLCFNKQHPITKQPRKSHGITKKSPLEGTDRSSLNRKHQWEQDAFYHDCRGTRDSHPMTKPCRLDRNKQAFLHFLSRGVTDVLDWLLRLFTLPLGYHPRREWVSGKELRKLVHGLWKRKSEGLKLTIVSSSV